MHVHSVANVAVDMEASSVAAMDWHFPLFVTHGVTGVRNMNDGTGKLADLVLLDADPLADISNTREIRAVVLDGRYLDRAALNELLARVERAASRSHEAAP